MELDKVIIAISLLVAIKPAAAQTITGVSTSALKVWVPVTSQDFTSEKKTADEIITIDTAGKEQEIYGFGGCFNEIGREALFSLSESEKEKVLRSLFSPEGANFTICRTPLGASDYSLSWYSYDDVPGDFSMRNFNIDRDRYILIPYIKAAQKINPNLKIWASPWSPPVWMKVNNHYALSAGKVIKTGSSNEMNPDKNIENNATAFKMEDGYLSAYALYFSKFVRAYQKEGIDIWNINVQNEIAYAPQWPSCTWRPEDIAYFIKKFLGPQFKADNIKTQIWLGTINYGNPSYVRTILNDTAASKYISGIGFQWGGKAAIGAIAKEYPRFRIMQTESECGNGENNWQSAEHTWHLMYDYLSNGANLYMYWNMILDKSGKSSWGWPQNTLISIDTVTKSVKYNPEFYLFKHLSHFILPGAHELITEGKSDHLAFMNANGTITLVYVNITDKVQHIEIKYNGKYASMIVPSKSFNTFNW